ncbi:MBL fold metallo-hydrolase [Alloalcanivorax xenomutans]|uniref:MBL fold metallo-hydrolase n=1 Tax=Alloalcanivorax xenomutans TaxID=1094342 RepID=UPI00047897B4
MIDWSLLEQWARRDARPRGRFRNLYPTPDHGLAELLRWQRETRGRFPPHLPFPLQQPDPALLARPAPQPRFTWIGHSTYLIQYRNWNLLTDPVFSERCSPVSFAGPKRAVPPALTIDALPPIHAVLVSHNHYDHLDRAAVDALQRRFDDQITWFAPTGVGAWLRRRGITEVIERGWWQHADWHEAQAFCLPTQHFSGRGPRDRNTTLWCGWRLQWPDFSLFFAGDTGYAPVFQDIHKAVGPVDTALLPIGAYLPRWFMAPVHINPEEAVRIHQDLQARHSLAMHWGTFVLTDEPMDEPPQLLARALATQGIPAGQFRVPAHGETVTLPLHDTVAAVDPVLQS